MSRKVKDRGPLSTESGTIIKHGPKKLTVALVYPNTYYVGMSNLGFQLVYRLFNSFEDVVCERAFLPDTKEERPYSEGRRELTTLETGIALSRCDIVAFSIPFENDYPNLLKLLSYSGIPLLSKERSQKDPLVMAGGVTIFINPEPLADFVDAFAIGEAEVLVPELVGAYLGAVDKERDQLMDEMLKIEGIYVPSRYSVEYNNNGTVKNYLPLKGAPARVKRRWASVEDVNKMRGDSALVSSDTEFSDMHLVELGRGCGRGCRFCAAGFIYLPPRERSLDDLKKEFREGTSKGRRIGLISPSLADHHEINDICAHIDSEGGTSSLSSIRADMVDDKYLKYIASGGQKTVTIAPEAGSERLRQVINKGLSDDDILEAVGKIADAAIPNIRFYFMIGLPTERDEDIEGIIAISKKCRDLFIDKSRVHGRVGKITLSVNCFVPKPFTPFQWHPMEDEKSLKRKLKRLRSELSKESNLEVINDRPGSAHLQGLLSRGDRRLGALLLSVHNNGGDWKEGIRDQGTDPRFYTERTRDENETFPWDVINMEVSGEYLWSEYRRGLDGKITPPCNTEKCTRCGVC